MRFYDVMGTHLTPYPLLMGSSDSIGTHLRSHVDAHTICLHISNTRPLEHCLSLSTLPFWAHSCLHSFPCSFFCILTSIATYAPCPKTLTTHTMMYYMGSRCEKTPLTYHIHGFMGLLIDAQSFDNWIDAPCNSWSNEKGTWLIYIIPPAWESTIHFDKIKTNAFYLFTKW